MNSLKRLLVILICIPPLMMMSCDQLVICQVVLDFPVSQQNVSHTDPEMREALQIIDEVFLANGYSRDKNLPTLQEQSPGVIAGYFPNTVIIKGHAVYVSCQGFCGTARTAKKTCRTMKEKLSDRFGTQRVRIEHSDNRKSGNR